MLWQKRTKAYRTEWQRKFAGISNDANAFALVGTALYWGEGARSKNCLRIANTDADLLALFVRWLKDALGVQDGQIRCAIQVWTNGSISYSDIEEYWATQLRVPRTCFRKPYSIKSRTITRKKKNIWPYGVCNVEVNTPKTYKVAISVLLEKLGKRDTLSGSLAQSG